MVPGCACSACLGENARLCGAVMPFEQRARVPPGAALGSSLCGGELREWDASPNSIRPHVQLMLMLEQSPIPCVAAVPCGGGWLACSSSAGMTF